MAGVFGVEVDGSEGRFAGGRLYYRHWPVPDPVATVVVSHGFAEHSGRYHHVAAALGAVGLDVWAADHRGHGRSEGERADIESLAAAVDDLDVFVDLVREARPDLPVFLVGHSMGGLIAAAYAEDHQDRLAGLGLSGPLLFAPPELLALADAPEIPDLGLADAVSSDPAVVADYKADPLNYLGPPPRGFLRAAGELIEVRRRLSELTVPILVMQGSADLLVSPQALRDVVAAVSSEDLTARLWPGLWHEIFNEPTRAEVLAVLRDWIVERLPPS
ncbi:lysophospholipase [Acidiferrimicrobium sp. IK]|uniref:alpha/beta hydrolase n=1 Tax=Acidiferrimicrobium sp. IK TaxID=2871700 RepID=UPI0021CAF08A|nr:alpha/beta hydrolase [Acidiferrimicrobium sp. IK]MCU4184510.1 lysophospholipase [Acidiferrimicrobium sp. IK]